MEDYLRHIKVLTDKLAMFGSPVSEEDLILHRLNVLPAQYRPFQTLIRTRSATDLVSIDELHAVLVCEELNLEDDIISAVTDAATFFLANRANTPSNRGRGFGGIGGRSRGGCGRYQSGNQNSQPGPHQQGGPPQQGGPLHQYQTGPPTQYQQNDHCPHYQICQKVGHTTLDCYHIMDFAYQGRIPSSCPVAMVPSPGFDDQSTWYTNAGATHHITSNLSNLDIHSRYGGSDSVQVDNGHGLAIAHTGSALLPSPSKPFYLKNILHCPIAATNLPSVQKFSLDNHCYFCFDEFGFLVKDKATGRTLYKGSIEHGLYPFHPTSCRPTTFHNRVSFDLWHARLSHPSLTIQKNIRRNFNFPISNKH
ncbi:hypothetical protein MRB53_001733 [Persea americana]|uniref:Uncharacterized protein n=1 Tax=Persea americana TaxID=3435 RepID=A0ACC2MTH9_PERAE|nr:hypothetical protein MRB53_001733 [Persea americana]